MKKFTGLAAVVLFLITPVCSLHAGDAKTVDCSKNSLAGEIAKLDKDVVSTVQISGNCTEDIVISGFRDLTLIGKAGASISATAYVPGDYSNSTTALTVEDSKVSVQDLTINGARQGVDCTRRSTCNFLNATIQGGDGGVSYQDQSAGYILGSSVIQNTLGIGLGIYGASAVNMRPEPWVTGNEAGPVISGHTNPEYDPAGNYLYDNAGAVIVLDGSFLRTDNVTVSDNGFGVFATRDTNIKMYGGGVVNNTDGGVWLTRGSTAGLGLPIENNTGGPGIFVGPLSLVQNQGVTFSGNNFGGDDVVCGHVTAISVPQSWCGN